MITLPWCLGSEITLADTVIEEIASSIEHSKVQQYITILESLNLRSECSNDLWECQEPGALADPTNLRCFSICIAEEAGCRSCCVESMCYQPPENDKSLGSCGLCSDDGVGRQYALAFVTV
jgi:hypothetical protein